MITVLYRTNTITTPSEATVATNEDLIELLSIFESTDKVLSYAIMDTVFLCNGVQSMSYYQCVPEAFPKFSIMEEF
jgi:hypothetical protein